MLHAPVLLKEVVDIFDPHPGQIYIDATVNGGGHACAIAEKIGASGTVIGIDWDCELIRELRMMNEESGIRNIKLVCDTYVNVQKIAKEAGVTRKVNGILFDLGFSSYHVEHSGRGFSFFRDEPLDMRYSVQNPLTAEEIVNTWTQGALEKIVAQFGEERYAVRIAQGIVEARRRSPLKRTSELVGVILKSIPRPRGYKRQIHPATRTFQALRIAVNRELENGEAGLRASLEVLASGGKIAVISFHSLEDRIVKEFMRQEMEKGVLTMLTKKPLRASPEETRIYPRTRSAKLRAARVL